MESCIECFKKNTLVFDDNQGTLVCFECGRVNSLKIIDEFAEWRTFDSDNNDPRRVGMPNNDLLTDRGLGTTISDSYLQKWCQRSQRSSLDSALIKAFLEIDQVSVAYSLTAFITEQCKKLFKHIYILKLTKGKSRMAIICSCVIITCKKYKFFCDVFKLVKESSVNIDKLLRVYEVIKENSRKIFPYSTGQKLAAKYGEFFSIKIEDLEKVMNAYEEIEDSGIVKADEGVISIMAVVLVESLAGLSRDVEEYQRVSGVNKEVIVEAYRSLFRKKYELLKGLGDSMAIAYMRNM